MLLSHAEGRFAILLASGEFAGLHGQGIALADLVLAFPALENPAPPKPVVLATYIGEAVIVP